MIMKILKAIAKLCLFIVLLPFLIAVAVFCAWADAHEEAVRARAVKRS